MSGKIRKQLGPVRKRLTDRIHEATVALADDDFPRLKELKGKVLSNLKYHEQLTDQLGDVVDASSAEQEIIDAEMGKCMDLNIEGKEVMASLEESLLEATKPQVKNAQEMERLTNLKIQEEIENLRLEADLKRLKIENLRQKDDDAAQIAKLPRMKLPTYTGQLIEWPTFWDSYHSMIHENRTLAKVDKFKFLMSCLEGEAKDTLRGFKITDAQYDTAIRLLKERYDDTEFIIHTNYDKLACLPKMKNSTSDLRETFNNIETILRSLESLGENVETKQLISMVKSKLPLDFHLKLEEMRDGDWAMDYLRKSISKLIVARERTELLSHAHELADNTYEYTGEALLNKDVKLSCVYCTMGHYSDECQTFKTLEQRKYQIRGRCFVCLSKNHMFRQCKSEKPCFFCKRKNNHHSSLCPTKFGEKTDGEDSKRKPGKEGEDEVELLINVDNQVVMKTAKICLINPKNGKITHATALLDTGAKNSYITSEKADFLQLKSGPPKLVKLNTFGNTKSSDMYTHRTNVTITQSDCSHKEIIARTCKNITGLFTKGKIPLEKYEDVWKGLKMADDLPDKERTIKVDFLIGNDYYDEIVKSDKLELDRGLYLINTSLGWMFSGRVPGASSNAEEEQSMLVDDSRDLARALWSLEGVGVQSSELDDGDESETIDLFLKTIRMNDGRYEVRWPWKVSKYELPTNYNLCQARLKSLLSKLDDDKKFKYDQVIQGQLEAGIIEFADTSEKYLQQDHIVTHYLPHHVVDSGHKLRIVYEGNAKTHQSKKSLNECMSRGPNLVSSLVAILLRFRMHPVAFIADIEKAYLQMQLHPDDRDVVRFLWVNDISKPPTSENIREFRFRRVIWGIISAAFLLACTIMYHLQMNTSETASDLMKNIYVDNLASGSTNVTRAHLYYNETKSIFKRMSMNMCKWSSNSKELMDKIDPSDKSEDKIVKLLGTIWNLENDTIHTIKHTELVSVITKRNILKRVGSIFDPLGLYNPVLLAAKLLIQDLWKHNLGWDETVPEELQSSWKSIDNDLSYVHTLTVGRCVNNVGNDNVKNELIVFTDASQKAYATSIYIRVSNVNRCAINLIFSKCRLAPINEKLTIPRLELMGVLIGCRSAKLVSEYLGIPTENVMIFTDSKCVVEWCKSSKDLKKFVSRRVNEIRTSNFKISYVKSGENPADVASRGCTVSELKENEIWWKGPKWVMLPSIEWPENSYSLEDNVRSLINNEEKGSKVLYEAALVADESVPPKILLDINIEKYSSHVKLVRITAWCLRFINNSRKSNPRNGFLNADELKEATNLWTKCIQENHFPKTIKSIDDKKRDQLTYKLGLYKDSTGLIRCAGRFTPPTGNPILLPKEGHYTNLVVIRNHRKVLHAGVKQTLSEIRNEYWILQGRAIVRKLIRQCLICIHWEGGPFKTPPFAPLPDYVVNGDNKPFTAVGLDYLGPLLVNDEKNPCKNWVCLFTCVKVRAIHLEVVQNMTAESFLLCIRRFVARRGSPKLIISDNGSQIKLGSEVLKKIWKNVVTDEDVQSYVSNEGISWKFIIEHAPWQGGFYERLVKIVKSSLKKSLGRTRVNNEQLTTLVTEIEAVINSRPLLYLNDDINSLDTLTPSHFTSINHQNGVPDIEEEYYPKQNSATRLLELWRKGQSHLNRFWKSWSSSYFQELRESHTLHMKTVKGEINRFPAVGEVVLIKEENQPRGSWKTVRVSNLITSEIDDVPRAAKLTTSSGKVLKRPFKDLYPLEIFEK